MNKSAKVVLVQITIKADTSLSLFAFTYGGALRQFNFLDDDFLKIVTLNSPERSLNDIAYRYAVGTALYPAKSKLTEQFVYCDGNYKTVQRELAFSISKEFDSCDDGVVVDSVSLNSLRILVIYDDKITPIPLSPLALSSLSATVLVYYLLFSRITFRFLRPAFAVLFEESDSFLRKYLFLVSAFCACLLCSPLLLLARLLFE